ncbi:MAG: hypothetical protein NPIRA03_06650 [Nitrospirales bacterium]|nr:MAG: hypothetical protein NPIRA03_06650 [Nitrospirales bacterium]
MGRLSRNAYFGDGSPIDDAVGKKIGEIYERMALLLAWQTGELLLLDNMLVAYTRDPYDWPGKIVVQWGTWCIKRQGR